MKNVKNVLLAATFASMSFSVFAADQVNSAPVNKEKVGVVSASNAGTLSTLEAQLKEKAEAAGAEAFLITSVSGSNKLHGTAVIYK
ncbi:DUF1471 domain-containing protein [Serratia plymuthica]|uniref:multiple stress resistance protein BhsA n=1 Tax=Enterobacterales TaxID=91347 RepID=UPI001BAF518F|nr:MULTISPECIES: YdgH/BhsA/McbA-like domain containing protein [Enterobacterales]MDH8147154.1 DUF1471 domain-containing protein [Klebsiella pneumoniae]HBK4609152.1 DUF1471 domain-containing protein [Serratia marcescens]QUY48697.1 DUF1471 domain-containing protein [Serratia plymuthica]WJV38547.1 DUF1471 domain-containing protein [Raoultella terrigena]HBK4673031.1 DUF1471 domain-containing protein [Serratia marcescens]